MINLVISFSKLFLTQQGPAVHRDVSRAGSHFGTRGSALTHHGAGSVRANGSRFGPVDTPAAATETNQVTQKVS